MKEGRTVTIYNVGDKPISLLDEATNTKYTFYPSNSSLNKEWLTPSKVDEQDTEMYRWYLVSEIDRSGIIKEIIIENDDKRI